MIISSINIPVCTTCTEFRYIYILYVIFDILLMQALLRMKNVCYIQVLLVHYLLTHAIEIVDLVTSWCPYWGKSWGNFVKTTFAHFEKKWENLGVNTNFSHDFSQCITLYGTMSNCYRIVMNFRDISSSHLGPNYNSIFCTFLTQYTCWTTAYT